MTSPAERIAAGTATPADLAMYDRVRAETRSDLTALRAAFRTVLETYGLPVAVSDFTQAILDAPDWTRLHLATLLVEALAAEATP